MVLIKKRNFRPYILNWLTNRLQLGLGIGNIYYVADSSSAFYQNLLDNGVPTNEIFSTVGAAESATTTTQNDVVLMCPGAYVETAEIAWDKPHTHLVGLGGLNIGGDYSEPNCVLYTITAAVGSTLTVTGQNCQFHNFIVENNADNAGNLTAATIGIYGTYWKNVAFHGHMAATQNTTAAAASLYITGAGMYPLLEDCIIGQNVWGIRSGANSGVLRFTSSGRPNGGIFRRCKLLSYSNTVTCAMVAVPAGTNIGRDWNFDQCSFRNDNPDYGTKLNQVFYLEPTGLQKNVINLKDCGAFGFDAWDDANNANILSDMAVPAVTGGLGIEPT